MESIFISCMDWVATIIGSYGWAIVIFTVVLRLILSPLDYKTRKDTRTQQEKMSLIKPQLDVIEKKYKDKPEKLNKKRTELYKSINYNPLSMVSGCIIPMILQFGLLFLFLAAFRAISNREMLGIIDQLIDGKPVTTESWLWVRNIWQPDSTSSGIVPNLSSIYTTFDTIFTGNAPEWAKGIVTVFKSAFGSDALNQISFAYHSLFTNASGALGAALPLGTNGFYILPILAGITTILNTLVNPPQQQQPTDQAGAQNTGKIMSYMFAGMAVLICWSSSAAFAIYWLTSNLIATLNSFFINKMLDAKKKKAELKTAVQN